MAGLSPHRTGFQEVDFFRTPLKGVDFSDCALEGITVSESLGELRGMKINPAQAVDLIPCWGYSFCEGGSARWADCLTIWTGGGS